MSDRQRIAVLLQASALLSHLQLASRCLADGWRSALIDGNAQLTGVELAPGTTSEPVQLVLRRLTARLFRADENVAGRGQARRAARRLLHGWQHDMTPIAADEAVRQVLDEAPFLWGSALAESRSALAAAHLRNGETTLWVAGPGRFRSAILRRARTLDELRETLASSIALEVWTGARADPQALPASGRWRAAAAAWRSRERRSAGERIGFARSLFHLGRFLEALAELSRLRSQEARVVRAECLSRLGRLRAARRELEKLEARNLEFDDLITAAAVAVRLYGNLGRGEEARRWVESAIARADRRTDAARAELVAFAAAWDRRDEAAMSSHLEAARPALEEPGEAWRWCKAKGLEEISRGEGGAAVEWLTEALRRARRRLSPLAAGDLWNELAIGRALAGDLAGAERGLRHALRLHREADGPRRTTVALLNLAEVRLRRGRLEGVDDILRQSTRENRQAGNWRGIVHDMELWIRRDLVRGRASTALTRAREAIAECERRGREGRTAQIRALAARALGWLGRSQEAAVELAAAGEAAIAEFEPEERPALWAHAADRETALGFVCDGPSAAVWRGLLAGAPVSERAWADLAVLEPYRMARLVFDLEMLESGWVPSALVRRSVAVLRRAGAGPLAERLEGRDESAWVPIARYLEDGDESLAAVRRLFDDVGAGELRLECRREGDDRPTVLVPGSASGAELEALAGGTKMRMVASWIDPLTRVVFQLALRALAEDTAQQDVRDGTPRRIVGESPSLCSALARLTRLAPESMPILVCGETGTGKELAARYAHERSPRAQGPFLPFNCAAVAGELLMSDLFGHVRGAFTGAARDRAGIFETARGGTVFLDEIGDLPLAAQGFLLRVLQEGEVRRIGESLPRSADVRVIAATHRDLEAMVQSGDFRADLFYRLRVARIDLPPLRERGDDVLLLAEHLIKRLRPAVPPRISGAAKSALLAHHWPGNVRELENVLSVAIALAGSGSVHAGHLDLRYRSPAGLGYHEKLLNYRRRLVREALAASNGNLARAARLLGLTRQALSYLVRKLGIDR